MEWGILKIFNKIIFGIFLSSTFFLPALGVTEKQVNKVINEYGSAKYFYNYCVLATGPYNLGYCQGVISERVAMLKNDIIKKFGNKAYGCYFNKTGYSKLLFAAASNNNGGFRDSEFAVLINREVNVNPEFKNAVDNYDTFRRVMFFIFPPPKECFDARGS